MNLERLNTILSGFNKAKIAVVGDFFLDRYWKIAPELDEPSVETGLTAFQAVDRWVSPGAAGTVMNNLAALGVGTLHAVGFTGDDGEGHELRQCLDALGVEQSGLIRTPRRMTPCYTKPLRDGVEMNRFDQKNRTPTPASIEDEIIAAIQNLAPRVDAMIIMDQVSEPNCGVLTDRVRECLISLGGTHPKPLIYADSRERISLYREMLIKCNEREAAEAFGMYDGTSPSPETLEACGFRLADRIGRTVFITMGANGQWVIDPTSPTRRAIHVPAVRVTGEIDICGAGDATSAALVASLCADATYEEAAFVGNLAASVTIRKLGQTGTASPAEILAAFNGSWD